MLVKNWLVGFAFERNWVPTWMRIVALRGPEPLFGPSVAPQCPLDRFLTHLGSHVERYLALKSMSIFFGGGGRVLGRFGIGIRCVWGVVLVPKT